MKTGIRLTSTITKTKLVVTELASRPHDPKDGYEDERGRWHVLHPAVYVTVADDDVLRVLGLDVQPLDAAKADYDRYAEAYAAEVQRLVDEVWCQFGYARDQQVAYFNYKAGCDCGCSPGFTLMGAARDAQRDFWLTFELDD